MHNLQKIFKILCKTMQKLISDILTCFSADVKLDRTPLAAEATHGGAIQYCYTFIDTFYSKDG